MAHASRLGQNYYQKIDDNFNEETYDTVNQHKFPMMKLVNYTLTFWLHDGGVAVCLRVPVEVVGKGFRGAIMNRLSVTYLMYYLQHENLWSEAYEEAHLSKHVQKSGLSSRNIYM